MPLKSLNKQVINDQIDLPGMVRVINILQQNVKDALDPLTSNISNDAFDMKNIQLFAGKTNIISHKLGRILKSWSAAPKGFAMIKDNQASNPSPSLTLWLETSADVIVDLHVW